MSATVTTCGRMAVSLTAAAVLVTGPSPAFAQASLPVVRLEGAPAGQSGPPRTVPVTRLDERERGADLDTARSVSLRFAEPMPVRDVVLLLLRGTPLSVAFESGVTAAFSGELAGLTLRQALETVMSTTNLDYDVRGQVVRVFPRRPSTRIFEVSHLDVRRSWQRRTRALASADAAVPSADLTADSRADFFAALESGVRALLSESGRLHVDRNAGVVQVTDFADRLDQAAVYVEAVSLRASRQVRIEARVLEVALSSAAAVDWRAVAVQAGAVRADASAGMRVTDFDGLLRAIAGFGAVRTLAAPRILAMNNEPAIMRVGSDGVLFETDGEARTTGVDGPLPPEIALTIVPQIGADGIVHMSVSPSIARRPGRTRQSISSIEADSVMRVRGGDTVVLAGLIREDREARTELVILITPTVVSAGASPAEGAR